MNAVRRMNRAGFVAGGLPPFAIVAMRALCSLWLLFPALPASAQVWVPQRNVLMTIPNAPGSVIDTTARIVHKVIQDHNLIPVTSVLVNRAGGEQSIGYSFLHQRPNDPHHVSWANPALLSNHISGRSDFTYSDFTPIAYLMADGYVFAVRADHPLKSGNDLVDVLRKAPDALTLAVGNSTHRIAIGMVLQQGKVDIRRTRMVVLQQGTQAAAAMGGHVDLIVSPLPQLLAHLQSGKLRPLALSATKRKGGVLANTPIWPELGYKNGTYQTWRALIAPRGITPAQAMFWENVMRKVVETDDFKAAAARFEWDIEFKGGAETRKLMEDEYARTKSVMPYLGLVKH